MSGIPGRSSTCAHVTVLPRASVMATRKALFSPAIAGSHSKRIVNPAACCCNETAGPAWTHAAANTAMAQTPASATRTFADLDGIAIAHPKPSGDRTEQRPTGEREREHRHEHRAKCVRREPAARAEDVDRTGERGDCRDLVRFGRICDRREEQRPKAHMRDERACHQAEVADQDEEEPNGDADTERRGRRT